MNMLAMCYDAIVKLSASFQDDLMHPSSWRARSRVGSVLSKWSVSGGGPSAYLTEDVVSHHSFAMCHGLIW